MRVAVYHRPADFENCCFADVNAVVIDVLRASTTIIAALENGCRQILAVETVEQAFSLAKQFPRDQTLLAGERGGRRVDGFDLGNSPYEFVREQVAGKTIVLTTTNGTRAIARAESAASTRILALTNLNAVTAALLEENKPVAVLCAGREGDFSQEDSVCAGLLVEKLLAARSDIQAGDGVEKARRLAEKHKNNLVGMLQSTPHGRYLTSIGFGLDLEYCARLNGSSLVPITQIGSIVATATTA
ncbi:MAG TPA: 2-phosphosulfolactate phosphatase [bacterium]|nr:2-phosphosulfolactate phosphatase [bacterium]HPG44809.1 2-phosphosulfolactate phosphatase [bacterium]HPM98162.1 2-phosphosulfolactate phosphatase [bacterium]